MASTCVPVEVAMCNKVVCPGELPVGLSTLLLHGPCSLSVAHWRPHVRPLCTCSPSSPTRAPSQRSSMQWGRVAILRLPMCMCLAQGCCCKRWRGWSSRLVKQSSARCHPPPRSYHAACENLSAHVQHKVTCQFPPTSSCWAQSQPKWSHCRLWSGPLFGHPSASTADSLLLLNITGVNRTCVSQRIPIAYRENADISKFNFASLSEPVQYPLSYMCLPLSYRRHPLT
jgi:hypothetical protein